MESTQIMDIEQTQEYLSVSKSIIYTMAQSGYMPAMKVGTSGGFLKKH